MMRSPDCGKVHAAVVLVFVLGLARAAAGQAPDEEEWRPPPERHAPQGAPEPTTEAPEPTTGEPVPKRTVSLFPGGDVYPVYVADPQRTGNAAMVHFYSRTEIALSSGTRTSLKAGGRFGVVRWDPGSPGGRSWQISLDAGLDAMFDSKYKLDNIGWDGNYGFTVTTASAAPLSFKLGVLHCSAHVGDEYLERTGRARIDYSREELAVGARYRIAPQWSAYGELAVAYKQLTEEQAPWRGQGGLEWESTRKLLGGHFVWYAAIDISLWQERDWRPDLVLQGGLAAKEGGRVWRFGVEYSSGRPPLGEFFEDTETRFTLGFWVDL